MIIGAGAANGSSCFSALRGTLLSAGGGASKPFSPTLGAFSTLSGFGSAALTGSGAGSAVGASLLAAEPGFSCFSLSVRSAAVFGAGTMGVFGARGVGLGTAAGEGVGFGADTALTGGAAAGLVTTGGTAAGVMEIGAAGRSGAEKLGVVLEAVGD